jgi:hypothetical protein
MNSNGHIDLEFITASHDLSIFKKNLLSSKVFEKPILLHYKRVITTYPKRTMKHVHGDNSILIYAHHDVYLPESFEKNIKAALEHLKGENWGVLGVAGVKLINGKKQNIGYISDRGKMWGSCLIHPEEADTLDELLLITKGDFVFDENLDLHFYGADICMQAKEQGRKNYVINAFVEHNSSYNGVRTEVYNENKKYFTDKWKHLLPVATTTAVII